MMRLTIAVVMLGLGMPAVAQELPKPQQSQDDPQRQPGAHAHGQGKLSIAIERRSIEIELEVPGSDIVGFEHAAKTAEQKAAVAKARAALAKPLALFKLSDVAGCRPGSAKVKLVGGGAHDHGHGKNAGHGPAAKAKEAAAPHSEFHAEYTFNCSKPELLQAIDFDYFKTFPGAEALDVTMIGPKGQSKHKVTRDKPRIELKGTS